MTDWPFVRATRPCRPTFSFRISFAVLQSLHHQSGPTSQSRLPADFARDAMLIDSPNSLYYKFRIKLTPACRALLVAGKADNPEFAWDLDESKFLESSAYQVFAGDGLLDEISERMAPWASEETPQVRYMCVFSNAPRRGFNFSQFLFLALHVDPRQKTGKGKTQDEAAGGQSQCQ